MIISGLSMYYNKTYESTQALFNVLVVLDLSKYLYIVGCVVKNWVTLSVAAR